jgi:Fe-S cluster biosynthesis and repair protein YggX
MSDTDPRIEQFRKMTNDDPDNELGHFSLGRELLRAGRADEAAPCFQRVIALNPNISKAWQMLATAQLQLNQRDHAIATLTNGVRVAHQRGDMLPKNEMTQMLQELGAEVPQLEQKSAPPAEVGEGQVHCRRCGRVAAKLPGPPFRSDFGREIHEHICADCWREAIGMGTKVINELRLPLADPQAQKVWDQHIREFLHL